MNHYTAISCDDIIKLNKEISKMIKKGYILHGNLIVKTAKENIKFYIFNRW